MDAKLRDAAMEPGLGQKELDQEISLPTSGPIAEAMDELGEIFPVMCQLACRNVAAVRHLRRVVAYLAGAYRRIEAMQEAGTPDDDPDLMKLEVDVVWTVQRLRLLAIAPWIADAGRDEEE